MVFEVSYESRFEYFFNGEITLFY